MQPYQNYPSMHCSNKLNHQIKNEVYQAGKKEEAEKATDSSNVKLTRHKLR
jgi:hypothetical protein